MEPNGGTRPRLDLMARGFVGPQADRWLTGGRLLDPLAAAAEDIERGVQLHRETAMLETRNQTVASMYLGIDVEMQAILDDALTEQDEDLFAEAFEAAQEAAKRVLRDRPEFRVDCRT